MGNGDGATDATVGQLASIEEGVAVMLSVTGFGDDSVLTQWETDQLLRQPSPQRVFEALIGPYDDVCHPKPKSRCLRTFEQRKQHARETFAEGHPGEWRYFRWPEQMLSWDGYAFRRPLPELSSKVLHPGIRMNLPGAENRAAMALYLALGRDALMYNRTLPNACGHVNWFHYHCTGAATVYDPTDSAAITTHEWRAMFGNASIPPASALAKSMGMAIGVDHTHDLELIVHDLIVPITSGCTEITDCLHSGKPDHRLLPDEVAFISGKEFDGVLWPPHPPPPPPSPPFEAEYEPSPSPDHDPLWKELLEWRPAAAVYTRAGPVGQPPFAPGNAPPPPRPKRPDPPPSPPPPSSPPPSPPPPPFPPHKAPNRRRPIGSGATSRRHRRRSRPLRRRRRRRRPRRRRRRRSRRRLPAAHARLVLCRMQYGVTCKSLLPLPCGARSRQGMCDHPHACDGCCQPEPPSPPPSPPPPLSPPPDSCSATCGRAHVSTDKTIDDDGNDDPRLVPVSCSIFAKFSCEKARQAAELVCATPDSCAGCCVPEPPPPPSPSPYSPAQAPPPSPPELRKKESLAAPSPPPLEPTPECDWKPQRQKCLGLRPVAAETPETCALSCCLDGDDCTVWQWTKAGCQLGKPTMCNTGVLVPDGGRAAGGRRRRRRCRRRRRRRHPLLAAVKPSVPPPSRRRRPRRRRHCRRCRRRRCQPRPTGRRARAGSTVRPVRLIRTWPAPGSATRGARTARISIRTRRRAARCASTATTWERPGTSRQCSSSTT